MRDSGEERDIQVVLRLNHKAPPCPDSARSHERRVLLQRDSLSGTGKIGQSGDDEAPFHDRCPAFTQLAIRPRSNLTKPLPVILP